MSREIKTLEPSGLSSESFDGKHKTAFNEGNHRYKWTCPCHKSSPSVGVTTFLKASYPTSMGLIQWFKSQTAEALFQALTVPGEGGYCPREGFYPISENGKADIIKGAKAADRATSQEMADIGTVVHEFCYLSDTKGTPKELLETIKTLEAKDKIMAAIDKFMAWKTQNNDTLIAAEGLIASPAYLYCGKFDRLANRNGKIILSDYKTSKSIYLDQFIQLGLYSAAIKEWLGLTVDGIEVLRFGKDTGEFQTLLITDPKEIQMFVDQGIRCRQTYDFLKLESDPRFDWKKK